ncbi:hypothetical protein AAVH_23658 [Aphelenchoides avenae]|nr:hypothetical protein AAVH_23658 [Aphelenchus avenae]
MVERAERGTNITRSVTLLYQRNEASPYRHTLELFGRPWCTDVPTPDSAIIKKWTDDMPRDITESAVADFFQFENVNLAKKLEVFVWTVEQPTASHYAFMFKVIDM